MSGLSALLQAALLLLASLSTIVSVAGVALSADVFGRLIYGSIAGGGALAVLVAAVALKQGAGIVALQGVILLLLAVPSGAIATHRIAALAHERARKAADPAQEASP